MVTKNHLLKNEIVQNDGFKPYSKYGMSGAF